MFDLFRSRAKAVRYLLGGLLMVVALSMVVTLIPGFGSATGANDPVLAEIGGEDLTEPEVRRTIDRFIRQGNIPPDILDVYIPSFIDQMIQQRAAVYQAQRMGLTVNDEEVLAGLRSSYGNLFPNGQLIPREQLAQILAQQGLSEQEWIENMRYQLTVRKIEDVVLQGIIIGPKEIQAEFEKQYSRAKIQYIAFPPAKFRAQIKITPEDVRAFYESHKNEYSEPEKRSLNLLVVDEVRVAATIQVSEAELRSFYNSQLDRFRNPERVSVRHILVNAQGKPDAEKAKAKAKAEDLLKQIKGGADFAELAKKHSDDPGSGAKGGDLGWVVRQQTVPEFEKAAFALQPKEMSGVVESMFGYHIIQAMAKEAPRTKSFDEVKVQLADEFKKQSVFDKMQQAADQARAELVKNPGQGQAIAAKYGLEFAAVANAGRGEPMALVGTSPEIEAAIAGLKKDEVTPVVQLPANRLAFAAVTEVVPSRPSQLSEVEGKIRDRLLNDKAGVAAGDTAKEAAEKLRAGADINQVAKSYGLEVTSPPEFSRSDNIDGVGQGVYFEDAFTKPVGTVIGPLMLQGRNIVAKTVEQHPADPSLLAGEREKIIATARQKKAVERESLFFDSVLTKLIEEGKVKINSKAIARVVGTYRRR